LAKLRSALGMDLTDPQGTLLEPLIPDPRRAQHHQTDPLHHVATPCRPRWVEVLSNPVGETRCHSTLMRPTISRQAATRTHLRPPIRDHTPSRTGQSSDPCGAQKKEPFAGSEAAETATPSTDLQPSTRPRGPPSPSRSPAANLVHRHGGTCSRSFGPPRFLWRFPSCVQGVREAESWRPEVDSASVT
jgi:hypothetical protein